MSDLTPEQCARALELRNVWSAAIGGVSVETIFTNHYGAWLAVEKHILESHKTEWRPVTRDEIQAGWEIRTRRPDGSEAGWGTAHHQDDEGDWRTEADTILTFAFLGWTSETTAPAPKPKPDPCVELLAKELHKESECKELWPCAPTADSYRERARRLLAKFDDLKNDNTNNN